MPKLTTAARLRIFAAVVVSITLLLGVLCSTTWAEKPSSPLTRDGTWKVDPMHTSLDFAVEHFGISMVHGRFNTFEGAIISDSSHLDKSSVAFTIDVASIDTNVKMRDDDLRSASYFDAAKYPTITFQSTRIEKAMSSRKKARYIAFGKLTMHGVTKEIALPFVVNGPIVDPRGNVRIGVLLQLTLRRLDFGIGGAQKIASGALGIGDEVKVDISVEALLAKP